MAQMTWTEHASDDLEAITRLISRDSGVYAKRTARKLLDHSYYLMRFPMSRRVVPELGAPDIREIIDDPYRIVYRIRGEDCCVIAVAHTSSDLRQILVERLQV